MNWDESMRALEDDIVIEIDLFVLKDHQKLFSELPKQPDNFHKSHTSHLISLCAMCHCLRPFSKFNKQNSLLLTLINLRNHNCLTILRNSATGSYTVHPSSGNVSK